MKLVHQALSAHPHSQPYPRLTRFNSHRSAAPDKAASFKSLYLNRPAEDQAPSRCEQWAVQIQH